MQESLNTICLTVNLYGSLARLLGHRHIAQVSLTLPVDSTKADLLAHLGVPPEERGYLFINAVLHDVPGLETPPGAPLKDGDHVGIFAVDRLWPYQYRDGVRMSEDLTAAMSQHGAMHHSY